MRKMRRLIKALNFYSNTIVKIKHLFFKHFHSRQTSTQKKIFSSIKYKEWIKKQLLCLGMNNRFFRDCCHSKLVLKVQKESSLWFLIWTSVFFLLISSNVDNSIKIIFARDHEKLEVMNYWLFFREKLQKTNIGINLMSTMRDSEIDIK